LQDKWKIYREFKENYNQNDLLNRMSRCVSNMLKQEVKYIRTFVDADSIVEQKCIDAAARLKSIYSDKIKIDIAIQPLEGLEDTKSRENFIEACEKADYIGGLLIETHRLKCILIYCLN
jgi:cytosine/adenosine deaminase-related metal-dependent hydrolase